MLLQCSLVMLYVSHLLHPLPHITVQGIMQHWQSSPHQHGSLTGGFETGPFAIEGEGEPDEVADVVDGGGMASRD